MDEQDELTLEDEELTLEDELVDCKSEIDDTTIDIDDSIETILEALSEEKPIDPKDLRILRDEIATMHSWLDSLHGLVARLEEHHLNPV